jgi:hypothetical protein
MVARGWGDDGPRAGLGAGNLLTLTARLARPINLAEG